MTSGIYEILNTTNSKRYIGSAVNLASRWIKHRSKLLMGKHENKHLQRAWNKYGEGVFKFLPILTCAKSMLLFYEQQLLDKVKPEYNIATTAGSTLGVTPNFETRKKLSDAHTGMKNPAVSESNRKRICTDETRKRMGDFRRGKPRSKESVEKGRIKHLGQKRTAEQCANISKGKRESWDRHKALEASLQNQPQGV